MKNALRIIVSLIIIGLFFTCVSCGPNHLDDRPYEQVIIDPYNPETYFYSYSSKANEGWDERPNVQSKLGSEEGYFWFTTEDNTVTLSKTGVMAEVRYYHVANSPEYIVLPIIDNTVVKENVTANGVFRTYGSLQH